MTTASSGPTDGSSAVSSTAPTGATGSGGSGSATTGATLTGASTISSMSQLQKMSPALYQAMMEGIAWGMCTEQQKADEKFHEQIVEEERRQQGG